MTDLRDDNHLHGFGEVLRLSWPASLSMLNSTAMRFMDGLLVSFIGTVPFTAQLVAGMASFVPESFATGLLTVVNTYVAQNLGAKFFHRCGQYAWAGLVLAAAFFLFMVPLIFIAEPIFMIFNGEQMGIQQAAVEAYTAQAQVATGQEKQLLLNQAAQAQSLLNDVTQLQNLEVMYFQYMILAGILTLTARPLEQFFYGVHRPGVVLKASIAANLTNLILTYILVFGSSGLIAIDRILGLDLQSGPLGRLNIPKYGLEGAAWANLISWSLYLVIMLSVFLSRRINETFASRKMKVKMKEVLDLVRIGWPAGVQFVNDVLPWSLMLAWLVGRFGPIDLAATSAAMRWMPLSFMPAVGIGIATTALVGRYLGQGAPHLARRRTYQALVLALLYMGLCGLMFFIFRHELVEIFVTIAPSPDIPLTVAAAEAQEIIRIGGYVMICAAIFQLFDAVGIIFIGGLRGAGDTFWPMIATFFLSWGLTVGGGYMMVRTVPQLGSIGPWIAASMYVVVLGLVLAWRFKGGSWQRIDLLHKPLRAGPAEDTPLPPVGPPSPPSPPSTMQNNQDLDEKLPEN